MLEKILIFKSQPSGAVYYWHKGISNKIVVMKGVKNRRAGSTHYGIPQPILQDAFESKSSQFLVGDAVYIILARI